jgi:hypothetical protein
MGIGCYWVRYYDLLGLEAGLICYSRLVSFSFVRSQSLY